MSRVASPEKRAEWRRRLERFERSSLTVLEFCNREAVSMASYYYWRRQLQASPQTSAVGLATSGPSLGDLFVPLQVTSSPGRTLDPFADRIEVQFPNGVQLSLPAHDPQWVRTTLATLAVVETTREDVAC